MGMYDNIVVGYPLPDGHNTIVGWQTKNLACVLDVYQITHDGRLTHDGGEVEPPYDGDLHFYAFTDYGRGEWIEYRATFRNGRVTEMTRIPDRFAKANTAQLPTIGVGTEGNTEQ